MDFVNNLTMPSVHAIINIDYAGFKTKYVSDEIGDLINLKAVTKRLRLYAN